MQEAKVHPSAVVDSPASIGHRSMIWHFCHVCAGATIGEDCVIGQNGYVASTVVIGDRCRIQNNVSLYDGVVLDDEVFIGPSAVFTNVINPRAAISRRSEYRSTRVGRGATIGANATIVAGVTLGRFCFIGAGAVVSRDVPPHALVVGVPAKVVGWMSRAGHRLHFARETNEAVCPSTGERYHLVAGVLEVILSPNTDTDPHLTPCSLGR